MGPSYMNEKTNYRPLKDRTQNLFILFIALGTFLSCASNTLPMKVLNAMHGNFPHG